MTTASSGHAAVIGAGIIGICAAAYLQRAGFAVTLVDPEEPGTMTSYGNAGSISAERRASSRRWR